MLERIISEESAREQFQGLLDFYGVELESLGEVAQRIEKKLVDAISYGKIEVSIDADSFSVTQHLRNKSSLVYGEVNGLAKVAMERHSGSHEKLYGLLAVLSKKPIAQIQNISGNDLSIAECLAAVFLAG